MHEETSEQPMTRRAARDATRGFFLLLVAAFLFLAGFVFLIIGIGTPSPPRVILAVALLAASFLLMRSGYAAWKRTTADDGAAKGTSPGGDASRGQQEGPPESIGRRAGESSSDDRMDR